MNTRTITTIASVWLSLCSTAHADWVQTNGPYGGTVTCLAIGPNGAGGTNLFAGGELGVFLSTNNGTTWTAASTGLHTFVNALAVSGTNLFAGGEHGVFLSTNNGTSWTEVDSGLPNTYVHALAVSPNGAGGTNLFAGGEHGVFLSTNNGTSWTATNTGLTNLDVPCMAVSGTNLFAGTYGSGVFLSTNNGTSWTAVNIGLPKAHYDSSFYVGTNTLAVSGTNLFAGTYGLGVFLSTNSGTSWTAVNAGLTDTTYVSALAVSGTNLYAGTVDWSPSTRGGVYLSTNNGTSWTVASTGLATHTNVYTLAVSANGKGSTNLFAGTFGGGVYFSTDSGTSWSQTALRNTNVVVLTASAGGASGSNLFAGVSIDIFTGRVFLSTNDGMSWTAASSGLPPYTQIRALAVSANAAGGTNLFAGTDADVYLSTNNGTSWTAVSTGFSYVFALAVSPDVGSGTNLFAGTYEGGIFRSTNSGTSWTPVNAGLPSTGLFTLAVSDTNLFAGTFEGVYRSTNNGTSWTAANTGLPTYTRIKALAVSANGAGGTNLFAGISGGGVFLSTNNGTSWAATNTGLTNLDVHCMAVSGASLFVGTNGGVFASNNNGTSWTATNAGLTNLDVACLAINGANVYAGTFGGGVWRRPLSEMITSTIPTAGLQLWLRSDAGVDTLNGKVSRWRDQSGKGNDAIQFNTARQPLFVAGELNQKPVLRFDGFDDKLGFTGSTPMSQFTLFLVVKNYSGGGPHNSHVINFGPSGGDWNQWFFILWGGLDRIPDLIAIGEGPNGGMFASAPNIAANGEWRIISIVYQTILNTTLRWNGSNATMTPVPPVSFFGPMGDSTGSGGGIAGADGVPNGNLLTAKCDFAEAIVYDTVLTVAQQLAIEQYLNVKYNVFTGVGVNEQQRNLPERFALEQNYPNPFNPSTTIRYGLPYTSVVQLTIFNTLGQQVATLVQGEQETGYHEVRFDAFGLSSGVYFYRLQAGDFVGAKKLMLVK